MHQARKILSKWRSLLLLALASLLALLIGGHLNGNQAAFAGVSGAQVEEVAIAQVDLSQPFEQLGLEGSVLIYDQNANQFYEHNPTRNTTAFFPLSTFKILNALVSLETGVIRDDVTVLTWDGIEREFPSWNRDTNLRQGFKDSTIWFYQVLARKVGHERMQDFVNQVEYGNRNIGTVEAIDRFWLEGPLRITPHQQIEFLQKLYRNELPFSQRTIDLVKDIMVVERTPDYVLRGKTGLDTITTGWPKLGWFVGYLEQNDNVYFFATNIATQDEDDFPARIEVTRRSLQALGLF
ncbi:class D beta-lactamase [Leptolyngbya sp. FACHB-541]|uniref:class D beta-lactamase n=1 Tax=Leptolyngbya sp. FACHB-541 TaxID=2692810 RepID=UPI0016833662|nr:class D beta-lactamase [Leptolyngbya sp. FACHB-541]MBD2000038.1 class D beta-lactamase [Leptolyngbya sp. FACHB-541]